MRTTTATKTSLVKLELNSKGLYQSSGKTQENCCFAFQSSTKREIRHFHSTTTTTIFISCPEKFTIDQYMQREKINNKKNEHSHLEIAKANRAKWLGQAEKSIAIKLQSIKNTHTHAQRTKKKVDVHAERWK